jgi:hypothetical protein
MEWAVHVGNERLAERWDDLLANPLRFCEGPLQELQTATARLFQLAARRASPRRAYFGNEFCESLIPSLQSFSQICLQLWRKQVEITFVTPPVTDEGLDTLRKLLSWLSRQEHNAEVVFNDWGTLELLYREFPGLRPVRGRLLNKTMRDPRVVPLYNAPGAPAGIRASLQPSSLDSPFFRRLLQKYGVTTVELDILVQAPDFDFRCLPFQVAFYFPYGFVTTGRHCMMSSLHVEGDRRFRPGVQCRLECRDYVTTHSFDGTLLSTAGTRFYQRGNTFFYYPDEKTLLDFLECAQDKGVARLVYEPGLPM